MGKTGHLRLVKPEEDKGGISIPYVDSLESEIGKILKEGGMTFAELKSKLGPFFDRYRILEAENARYQNKISEVNQENQILRIENSELKEKEAAGFDDLTGLPRRRSNLIERIKMEAYTMTRKRDYCFVVGLVDIDHFKGCNDVYGHLHGDRVLSVAANILKQETRENDGVYRFGGDEFALVLNDVKDTEVKSVLERIKLKIEKKPIFLVEKDDLRAMTSYTLVNGFTVSIGAIAVTSKVADTSPEYLISIADENLYKAKDLGRNSVVI